MSPPFLADTLDWDIPLAFPVADSGESQIPELGGRGPTRSESILISGQKIAMGSSNVKDMWWKWDADGNGLYNPQLWVAFLNGSIYSYNGPAATLTLALGMLNTASPGRYVWNVLRILWPVPSSKGVGPGTYTQHVRGTFKGRPKPQVIRRIN